jgi:hypothetical protein
MKSIPHPDGWDEYEWPTLGTLKVTLYGSGSQDMAGRI